MEGKWRQKRQRRGVCISRSVCVLSPSASALPTSLSLSLSLSRSSCMCVSLSLGFQKRVCPPACTEREGGVSSRLLLPALPLALCYFSFALIPSLAASGLGLLSLSLCAFHFLSFFKSRMSVCFYPPLLADF